MLMPEAALAPCSPLQPPSTGGSACQLAGPAACFGHVGPTEGDTHIHITLILQVDILSPVPLLEEERTRRTPELALPQPNPWLK